MTTRSGLILHRDQPRRTRTAKLVSSGSLYPPNTFAGLPFDVKYHFLHEFLFSPSDLLSLSHVNRVWRESATADSLWAPWYEVFPEHIKRDHGWFRNVSKRDLVMLGMTARCMGCKAWSGCISAPLMLRLCRKCLVDDPLYNNIVDEDTRVIYRLAPKDVQHLVSYACENYCRVPMRTPCRIVSERALIEVATEKYGGAVKSMYYTQALSRTVRHNNEIASVSASLPIGTLHWENEKLHHAATPTCDLCEEELLALYRAKHGHNFSGGKTVPQEIEIFKIYVYLMPNCRVGGDRTDYKHFLDTVWRKPCTAACKGQDTCEPCCRERALREYLGDDKFDEEVDAAEQHLTLSLI